MRSTLIEPEMGSWYTLRYVVRLSYPVCGPRRAFPDCAPLGTLFVLAPRVSAEPLVVPGGVLFHQIVRALDVC